MRGHTFWTVFLLDWWLGVLGINIGRALETCERKRMCFGNPDWIVEWRDERWSWQDEDLSSIVPLETFLSVYCDQIWDLEWSLWRHVKDGRESGEYGTLESRWRLPLESRWGTFKCWLHSDSSTGVVIKEQMYEMIKADTGDQM